MCISQGCGRAVGHGTGPDTHGACRCVRCGLQVCKSAEYTQPTRRRSGYVVGVAFVRLVTRFTLLPSIVPRRHSFATTPRGEEARSVRPSLQSHSRWSRRVTTACSAPRSSLGVPLSVQLLVERMALQVQGPRPATQPPCAKPRQVQLVRRESEGKSGSSVWMFWVNFACAGAHCFSLSRTLTLTLLTVKSTLPMNASRDDSESN